MAAESKAEHDRHVHAHVTAFRSWTLGAQRVHLRQGHPAESLSSSSADGAKELSQLHERAHHDAPGQVQAS